MEPGAVGKLFGHAPGALVRKRRVETPPEEADRAGDPTVERGEIIVLCPVDCPQITRVAHGPAMIPDHRIDEQLAKLALDQTLVQEATAEAGAGVTIGTEAEQTLEGTNAPGHCQQCLVERNPRRAMVRDLGVDQHELPDLIGRRQGQVAGDRAAGIVTQDRVAFDGQDDPSGP